MTSQEPQQPRQGIFPAHEEKARETIERAFINASFVRRERWKLMKVFSRGFDVISVTSGNQTEN